ncbi:MAG TPA: SRPBCC family protein [Panacibacter sp.]|nr:SRPBCC family protein [Panacibacter sp.]HNP44861.1 SRPBCC family protein [Panacibacter sp.]
MRFLKLAVVSFLVLFGLTTAIGLLFPSTVKVSRAVNISAPVDSVYKYLEDVKYWKLWMAGADTGTISFLSAKTAGKGTVATVGTGQVTIVNTTKDSILTEWKSQQGNIQQSAFIVLQSGSTTTVEWYFQQLIGWYPWERFGSLANDKLLGPVMEESFDKLKKVLEKPAAGFNQ